MVTWELKFLLLCHFGYHTQVCSFQEHSHTPAEGLRSLLPEARLWYSWSYVQLIMLISWVGRQNVSLRPCRTEASNPNGGGGVCDEGWEPYCAYCYESICPIIELCRVRTVTADLCFTVEAIKMLYCHTKKSHGLLMLSKKWAEYIFRTGLCYSQLASYFVLYR